MGLEDILQAGSPRKSNSRKFRNVTIKDNVIKVISNNNNYTPAIGDKIIGKVISMNNYGWKVNIGKSIVELDLRDASTSFIEIKSRLDLEFVYLGSLLTQFGWATPGPSGV